MSFSINGNPVASWDVVLQDAVSGDMVGVSNETISNYARTEQTLADGINFTIDGTSFSGNSSTVRGGALSLIGGISTISGSVFENNSTDNNDGGALFVQTGSAGSVTISDTVFAGNTVNTGSNFHGGAIRNSGKLTLDNVVIAQNGARTGGGIYNEGALSLTDVLFVGNTAAYGGGALRNNGGSVTLSGVTFAGNYTNNGTQTAMRNQGRMSIEGLVTIAAGEDLTNDSVITVDGSKFITGDALTLVKVVEAESQWYSGTGTIAATDGYGLLWGDDGDLYVINAQTANVLVSTNASPVPGYEDLYYITDAATGTNYISANVVSTPETATGEVVIDGNTYTAALTVSGTNSYLGINGAVFAGGARMELASGTDSFTGLTFCDYSAAANGAVIGASGSSSKSLTIRDCLFENNSTSNTYSGAVHIYNAAATIADSVFRNNRNTNSKGYGGVAQCASTTTVSGSLFEGNSTYMGGALAVWAKANITISDTVFDHNFASSSGGAVYVQGGAVTFTNVWFNGNTSKIGGALCNNGGTVTLNGVTFTDNALTSGSDGKAVYNYADRLINITGEVVLGAGQQFKNSGTVTVDGTAFLSEGVSIALVVDANDDYASWHKNNDFVTESESSKLFVVSKDMYVTNADAVYAASAQLGGDFVYNDLAAALAAGSSTVLGQDYSGSAIEITDAETVMGMGTALNTQVSVAAGGSLTLSELTVGGAIANAGTVILTGENTVNAGITGDGAIGIDAADITFANAEAITLGALTLGTDVDLTFAGGVVNFTSQDLSAATLIVDGSQYVGTSITVATGVTAIDQFVITGSTVDHLSLAVDGSNNLVLGVKADVEDGDVLDSFTGGTDNLMTGGTITGAYVGIRNAAQGTDVTNVISGGTVGSAVIGGALVSSGSNASLGTVSLDIAGVADVVGGAANGGMLYTAGYAYGANSGALDENPTLTVAKSVLNLTAGSIPAQNLYAGAHARKGAYTVVTETEVNVTGGSFARIYGGGWSEKLGKSEVGSAAITVSGGVVDYIYAGGANGPDNDGGSSVVTGDVDIAVSGDASVGIIFLAGKNQFCSIEGDVTLTVTGTAKAMTRVSGYNACGDDKTVGTTTLDLRTSLDVEYLDHVDVIRIAEGKTLNVGTDLWFESTEAMLIDFDLDGALDTPWTAMSGVGMDIYKSAQYTIDGGNVVYTYDEGTGALGDSGYGLDFSEENKVKFVTLA